MQIFIKNYAEYDSSLDVIKLTPADTILCSMQTLYYLADCGVFDKEAFLWKDKRKPNGKKELRGKQATELYPKFDTEFGYLEGDMIVGKYHKSAVITLAEKQSKAITTL